MSTTSKTREMNRRIIVETVRRIAGGSADARALLPTAKRESNFAHRVDAKHEADIKGATKVFERLKDTTYKNNPWRNSPALWQTSRGLFQMMVPYHVTKFGEDWAPTVLWHPVAATIAAARIFNRLAAAGAKNMCEIRSGWAGGPGYWNRDPKFDKRCASLRSRLESMGLPVSLADKPVAEFGLQPFGRYPKANDNAVINAISKELGIPGIGNKGSATLNYPENYDTVWPDTSTPQTTPHTTPGQTPSETPSTPGGETQTTPQDGGISGGTLAVLGALGLIGGAIVGLHGR